MESTLYYPLLRLFILGGYFADEVTGYRSKLEQKDVELLGSNSKVTEYVTCVLKGAGFTGKVIRCGIYI
jgi:hypothetical protein